MTKRQILFVTGTRADYGKLEPLAEAARDGGFGISFFITGMHMMARYGETRHEVKRFAGAEFFEFVNQRAGDPQDLVLAKTVLGFSDFVHEHRPDLVVVHGDRIESLAVSLVCATRYLPAAHIEGGEVSGNIDESIRHCNSKLCASHFVSSEQARGRVLSLGEPDSSIYVVGSPELDSHGRPSGVTMDAVRSRYGIPFADYGIAVFHPVTSEADTVGAQAQALFDRLEASGRNFVVILPNNDPGTEDVMAVLERLPEARFRLIPSMRFAYFSELMRNASAFVGNSSVGVREAPFLGIPSLDVGTRQSGRAAAPSVTGCSPYDAAAIDDFLKRTWGHRCAPDTSFGAGNAAQRFVDVLRDESFWNRSLQKTFHES